MIKLKESRVFKIELYLHKSGGKSILQNEDKFDNLKSFFWKAGSFDRKEKNLQFLKIVIIGGSSFSNIAQIYFY